MDTEIAGPIADSPSLELVEATLHELAAVSTQIGRLLDARSFFGWTAEQRVEVEQLLEEEDQLREKLHAAGGPSWDSSRRWVG